MRRPDPVTLAQIRAIAAEARAIDDDDAFVADVVEGETDAHELARAAIREMREVEALAEALKLQIEALTARKRRFDSAHGRLRDMLRDVLQAAGLRKLVLPEATVSLRDGQPRAVIDDERDIPRQLCKPDATAIKRQLLAGETVPGAHLEPGAPSITVRTK